MLRGKQACRRGFAGDDGGSAAIDYALVIGLVSGAVLAGLHWIGPWIAQELGQVEAALAAAANGFGWTQP